jgi:hypothetical protein
MPATDEAVLGGDWAGATYPSQGCPGNCVDYVNNNPGAFANAYWDIAAVRVYTPSTSTGSVTTSVSPLTLATPATTNSISH